MLFALGAGKGFLAHRETDGSLHVYAALRVAEDWARRHGLHRRRAAKADVLEHFDGLGPGLRR